MVSKLNYAEAIANIKSSDFPWLEEVIDAQVSAAQSISDEPLSEKEKMTIYAEVIREYVVSPFRCFEESLKIIADNQQDQDREGMLWISIEHLGPVQEDATYSQKPLFDLTPEQIQNISPTIEKLEALLDELAPPLHNIVKKKFE